MIKIPEQDLPIAEIVFKYGGRICGGYLRDLIAGVKPNDMDVCVPDETVQDFYEEITKFGYILPEWTDGDAIIHNKFYMDGHIDLDVIEEEHPVIYDFDINSLIYDGVELSSWLSLNVSDIIEHIVNRKMVKMNDRVNVKRIDHMIQKGYTNI